MTDTDDAERRDLARPLLIATGDQFAADGKCCLIPGARPSLLHRAGHDRDAVAYLVDAYVTRPSAVTALRRRSPFGEDGCVSADSGQRLGYVKLREESAT